MRSLFTLKILGVHFLFLALPLILNSFLLFDEFYRSSIKRAMNELKEVAVIRTYALSELEPESDAILNALTFFFEQEENEEILERKLRELGHLQPLREYIYFKKDQQGYKAVASSIKMREGVYAHTLLPVEKIAFDHQLAFLSYKKLDGETESYAPYLMTAKGVRFSEEGEPLSFIVQEAKIEKPLKELLTSKENPKMQFAVLSSEGVVVAASQQSFIGNYFNQFSPVDVEKLKTEGILGKFKLADRTLRLFPMNESNFFEFYFDGHPQLAFAMSVPELDFYMMVYQSKQALFDSALSHFFWIYVLFGAVILVGGLLAFWLALWIARPLRQLSYLMGIVSDGKYDQYFQPQPLGFEINTLGEVFNSTLESLRDNIEKEKQELTKKDLLRAEIDLGREVQESLLTVEQPKVEGIDSSLIYLPGQEVAGSFHLLEKKFYKDGQEYLLLVLAEPKGVGISSVLYSLTLRSFLRGNAAVRDDLEGMLKTINKEFLQKSRKDEFEISAFVAFIEPISKKMEYINCGMPLPWIKKEERLSKLEGQKATSFGSSYFQTPGSQFYTFEKGERFYLLTGSYELPLIKECSLKEEMKEIKEHISAVEGSSLQKEVIGLGVRF
jgi:phosphoserine phosphatase RsbU/P